MLFEFNLEKAIKQQLLDRLNDVGWHNLASDLAGLIDGTGVYIIAHMSPGMSGWIIMYAGKATRVGLKTRLLQHTIKLKAHGLPVENYYYKALHIGQGWLIRAAEDMLIQHFAPEWNGTGFGNHNPGKGRPGIKQSKWEAIYSKCTNTKQQSLM